MTPLSRGPRGVTLIELMVALLVTAVVLAAILGVVQAQQTAYFEGHLQRSAQGSARSALNYIEQRLSLAGAGMDAPLAFDFDRYGVDPAYPMPCPALAAGCPRDSVNGNDELVFHSRNPRYWVPDNAASEPRGNAWRVLSIFGNSLRVNARPGDLFPKGRILQIVCKNATRYAYMTVAANAGPVPGDPNLPTPVTAIDIPLLSPVATDPFRRQDTTAADGCFTGGEAHAFRIDRTRFHVRPPAAAGGLPYLVLDAGIDANQDGADEAEEIIVAEGIESFQVGYVMTNPALAARGTIPGTPIAFAAGAAGATSGDGMTTLQFPGVVDPNYSEYAPTSWYGYLSGPPPAAERMTDHQANIRGVRIAIVARGPQPEPGPGRVEPFAPILNESARPSWIQPGVAYNRARVETTVLVRNMTTRAMSDF